MEKIIHIEIDKEVVDVSKNFFPKISNGAFADPRVDLKIMDGREFLLKNEELFDVVLVDSSDPGQGPNESLFGDDFYSLIKKQLDPNHGILCFQAEHQWIHKKLIQELSQRCRKIFPVVKYFYTQVPTYPGGQIGFFLCSPNVQCNPLKFLKLDSKIQQSLKYYSPEIHHAAFCLPRFVEQYLN